MARHPLSPALQTEVVELTRDLMRVLEGRPVAVCRAATRALANHTEKLMREGAPLRPLAIEWDQPDVKEEG